MNYPIRNAKQRIYRDRMRVWVKAKNADACLSFVAEMSQSKNPDALPALMELLRLPNGFGKPRPTEEMCKARESAVHAVVQIGAPDALICVGVALFNPCPGVRAVASQILQGAGVNAAEPLARMLTWRQNWSVEGMRVLLYTLGHSRNPNAAQPLMRVVTGELPLVPLRRKGDVCTELLPFFTVGIVLSYTLAVLGAVYLTTGWGFLIALCGVWTAFNGVLLLGLYSSKTWQEKRTLETAACEALQILGDKQAIPTLIAASQKEEREVALAAKNALYALLPTLCAQDVDWLPKQSRQHLATLLHQRNPELVLPVLRAMEFIGVGVAERRIASMITHGATPEIRAEAARISPILLERQRQQQISGTLLRASQSPAHAQDELLRPAVSTSDTAPQEMLRASNGQGGVLPGNEFPG